MAVVSTAFLQMQGLSVSRPVTRLFSAGDAAISVRVQCSLVLKKSCGAQKVQGTGRKSMEDEFVISIGSSSEPSFFGVFDGHGGNAVAEMLKTTLWPVYKTKLSQEIDPERATKSAYYDVDQIALAQPQGFLGALRERGLGGSQCGATAATVVLMPPKDGKQLLVAANVGDARVVLSRARAAIQLTVDHKPEVEAERKRIEARNPNPKIPLVVNVDGTWRLKGVLSLSRAFGDAYLKQWSDGTLDGTRGGFGLTSEPHVTLENISSASEDELIVIASDGLWENLTNQEVINTCLSAREKGADAQDIASMLIKNAQSEGTSDDIAVIVVFV